MKKACNPKNVLRGMQFTVRTTSTLAHAASAGTGNRTTAATLSVLMDRRHVRPAQGPGPAGEGGHCRFNSSSMCSSRRRRSAAPVSTALYQKQQQHQPPRLSWIHSQTRPLSSSSVSGFEGGRSLSSSSSTSSSPPPLLTEDVFFGDNVNALQEGGIDDHDHYEDTQTLLDRVAAECQKIHDKTTLESALHTALQAASLNTTTSTATTNNNYKNKKNNKRLNPTEEILLHEKIKHLEEATERLLQATKNTIPLAQVLLTQPPHDDRVRSLHRTFLSLLGKCVSTLRDAADPHRPNRKPLSRNMDMDNLDNNLLLLPSRIPFLVDKTLQLAVRVRGDLGLPLHLPLYQGLALTAAQASSISSSMMPHSSTATTTTTSSIRRSHTRAISTSTTSTTQWIVQLGTWAHEDFFLHHTKHDFFSGPLCVLAHRRCYEEVVTLLGSILKKHPPSTSPTTSTSTPATSTSNGDNDKNDKGVVGTLDYLDERTLSYLFRIIHDDLKTHLWESSSGADSPPKYTLGKSKNYPTRRQPYRSTSVRRTNHHRKYHRHAPLQITTITTVPATLEEILALLEPSLSKLFGELQEDNPDDDDEQNLPSTYMRDAIEILISPRRISNNHNHHLDDEDDEEDGLSSSGPGYARSTLSPSSLPGSREVLHALFPEEFSEDGESIEFWEGEEEEEDDDDDLETDQHLTSATWEFLVDMDSDLSVVSITRHRIPEDEEEDGEDDDDDDDDDEDDDYWSQHAPRGTKWHRLETVPDIVQQIEVASGQDLQYSKALQQDLLNQL